MRVYVINGSKNGLTIGRRVLEPGGGGCQVVTWLVATRRMPITLGVVGVMVVVVVKEAVSRAVVVKEVVGRVVVAKEAVGAAAVRVDHIASAERSMTTDPLGVAPPPRLPEDRGVASIRPPLPTPVCMLYTIQYWQQQYRVKPNAHRVKG